MLSNSELVGAGHCYDDEFNFYRATHAKRNILSALPTVTHPAGFHLDRNNGCDFGIQMHDCTSVYVTEPFMVLQFD